MNIPIAWREHSLVVNPSRLTDDLKLESTLVALFNTERCLRSREIMRQKAGKDGREWRREQKLEHCDLEYSDKWGAN